MLPKVSSALAKWIEPVRVRSVENQTSSGMPFHVQPEQQKPEKKKPKFEEPEEGEPHLADVIPLSPSQKETAPASKDIHPFVKLFHLLSKSGALVVTPFKVVKIYREYVRDAKRFKSQSKGLMIDHKR